MSAHLHRRYLTIIVGTVFALVLVAGCRGEKPTATLLPATRGATSTPTATRGATSIPTAPLHTGTSSPTLVPVAAATSTRERERRAGVLSEEAAATLSSLKQVDDYPLYTMHYYGAYDQLAALREQNRWMLRAAQLGSSTPEACSLFAALGDADSMLYGRNFDWRYSPALLLFTDPPDGYASVSMVDIAYLGFEDDAVRRLTDLPLAERQALLYTPFMPFDGMNEQGLVIGMAAVPESEMPHAGGKETLDSLEVIREMLDHARDVDGAIGILRSYNIDWGGGPPLHYLLADASGRALLVEFYWGEMVLLPGASTPVRRWHLATNFLRSSVGESAEGVCSRYDRISRQLSETEGRLAAPDALDLLGTVAQESTQWSVVYEISSGEVNVVMGRRFINPYVFPIRVPRR